MALIIVHLVIMVSFVILGVVFLLGKGAGLISGYNTMSEYERSRYDEKALCRFMGKFMFALAICWLPILLSGIVGKMALLWIGLALFIIVIIIGVVYLNTGNRFKK